MTTHTYTSEHRYGGENQLVKSAEFAESWYYQGAKHTIDAVKEWRQKFDAPMAAEPTVDHPATNALCIALLEEELHELEVALSNRDKVAALDALTDLQYLLDGTYLALGMAHLKHDAFNEVQRSNMSKLGEDGLPVRRNDGKILKGPNYFPPNLQQFFRDDI